MKYDAGAAIGLGLPPDADEVSRGLKSHLEKETLLGLYKKLPTSRMRLVVALHYDLGWSQELVAELLDIKQASLQDEIQHIRRVLKGDPYRPQKRKIKGVVKIEDLMKMCLLLDQP